MKWKSPRCSSACWDEIKQHDARLSEAIRAFADMRRDRDEWRTQHENLLAMYRAEVARRASAHSSTQRGDPTKPE